MGYESKIYFVRKYGVTNRGCEVIATLDMCNMGHYPAIDNFKELFNKPIDFSIFIPKSDTDYEECFKTTDEYGDQLKSGDIYELYHQIDNIIYAAENQDSETYWRYYLLRDMLFSFRAFKDIYVVHYGY